MATEDLSPARLIMRHEVEDLRKEISNTFGYMKEKLDLILEQTTKHNGRMTKMENERLPKLETWQAEVNTVSKVIKYIFGFFAVYIFAATGVLFNMWADWRHMKETIREAVHAEVVGLTLEEVNK